MLTREDSGAWHVLRSAGLILLSLAFLPFDAVILCSSLLLRSIYRQSYASIPPRGRNSENDSRLTILVTGVGMTKGLTLARLFHKAGHVVIGADFEENGALVCGRMSTALSAFYSLRRSCSQRDSVQYVDDLINIIKGNNVDIWVSCSGVAFATEDAEAKETIEKATTCKAVQFNVAQTSMLHEKHSFIEHAQHLRLVVPETHTVTSRDAAQKILIHAAKSRHYVMKCIGLDDSSRGDMTLLPDPIMHKTVAHLGTLNISPENPWILQEYIKGAEYCTHSLVIRGKVKAFVACPSSELLMHYEALPAESPLSLAMLEFTKTFAADGGPNFSGHLSFDFLVRDDKHSNADDVVLYPIECNPRAHTAVVLFSRTPGLVNAYTSLVPELVPQQPEEMPIVTPIDPGKYYWIGHDFITKLLLPVLHLVTGAGTFSEMISGIWCFGKHLFSWRDGTFELWDPLPWWWLYHVYWPMTFLNALVRGTKWSRINVSTTKMFMC